MTNPSFHIYNYCTAKKLQDAINNIMCLIFSMTLKKDQKDSIHGLSTWSILSICYLHCEFTQQFATSRSSKKSVVSLLGIEKMPDELLTNILKWFNDVKLQTKECSSNIVHTVFIDGLWHVSLRHSVGKWKAIFLSKLLEWFNWYIK